MVVEAVVSNWWRRLVGSGLLQEETPYVGCFGEQLSDQCVRVLSETRLGLVLYRLPHPLRTAVFRPQMSV